MNILTVNEAQANLNRLMDNVCSGHGPTVIARENGEHVVMLSLSDFNSIEETLYLLGSAKNSRRLMESVAQIKAGKAQPKELIRNPPGRKFGSMKGRIRIAADFDVPLSDDIQASFEGR